MKSFIVGHIDWSENELRLEHHMGEDWRAAVAQHSKYPWREYPQDDELFTSRLNPEAFKQTCFDCDCMMSWIEI
jgi:hypothetical protein